MTNKKNYFGRYTPEEYATVKQQATDEYGHCMNSSTIDDIMRYVASGSWPEEREKTYRYIFTAQSELLPNNKNASLGMMNVYDEIQLMFDRVHSPGYERNMPESYKVVIGGEEVIIQTSSEKNEGEKFFTKNSSASAICAPGCAPNFTDLKMEDVQ